MRRANVVVVMAVASASIAWASEDAPPPVKRFAVGGGFVGSTIEVDVLRAELDRVRLRGGGLFGRMALTERWGLQGTYLRADGIDEAEDFSFDQAGVHAYYFFFQSRRMILRTHFKFGLNWSEFAEQVPSVGRVSDDALGPSVGVGGEWGPPRWAFLFDFGVTPVQVELVPGEEESLTVGATIIGFVYRF